MAEAVVKLGDGNWATKEGKLLAHKQVGDKYLNTEFTVTRGTDATYVGRDGLIKQMSDASTELIQNGDFSATGTDVVVDGDFPTPNVNWTLWNATLDSGGARIDNGATTDNAYILQALTNSPSGKSFVLTYDVIATNGELLAIEQLSEVVLDTATTGTNRKIYFTWDRANDQLVIKRKCCESVDITIDNVRLEELGEDWQDYEPTNTFGENGLTMTSTEAAAVKAYQANVITNSKSYKVTYTIHAVGLTGTNTIQYYTGSALNSYDDLPDQSVGTHTFYYTAPSVANDRWYFKLNLAGGSTSTTDYVTISSISVKQISDIVGDIPRIDFLNNPEGHLLLEPASTNLIPYSNKLTHQSSATKDGGTVTTTDNYAVSPDGTNNAERLQASAPAYNEVTTTWGVKGFTTTDGSDGDAYSSSIYLKSNTGANQQVAFYVRGNMDPGVVTVTNEWQRFEVTGARNSTDFFTYVGVRPDLGSDLTCDILVYGWQVEVGAQPTSYIPTHGVAVTRAIETCTSAGAAEDFNSDTGVLYVEMAALGWTDTQYQKVYIHNSSNAGNNIQIRFNGGTENSAQYIMYTDRGDDGYTYSSLYQVSSLDTKAFHKYAIRYSDDTTTSFFNGVKKDTNVSPDGGSAGWGADSNNSNPLPVGPLDTLATNLSTDGPGFKIKAIRVYKEALSDADIITLTS